MIKINTNENNNTTISKHPQQQQNNHLVDTGEPLLLPQLPVLAQHQLIEGEDRGGRGGHTAGTLVVGLRGR